MFIGASLSLSSDDDLAALAATTGVINITPVRLLSLPDIIDTEALRWPARNTQAQAPVAAPPASNASAVTAASASVTTVCTGKGRKEKCTTSTIYPSATPKPSPSLTGFSALPQIQADQVQASGNKGKGVKIGIIDGGVDYTRAPLGGCFGPGCKIAGGYDFVGDNYDGSNTPVPDNDPFDNCYTHGTITAGIIGANDNEYNVTGVAPEATLYQYRVFGCNGASSDDIVIQAMLRAYQDDVDIINLSLGELSGWTNGALSNVASRLAKRGVIVTAAAGNQGQVGSWYSYSPGAGLGVINVGSTDNAIIPAQQLTTSTGYGPITYYTFESFTQSATAPLTPGAAYPIYVYTNDPNTGIEGCAQGSVDLSGKMLVVPRGACSLSDKARFAYLSGAVGVLVVNTPTQYPLYQNFPLTNFAIIGSDDGNYLIDQFKAGNNITLSFSFSPVAAPNTFTGNTTSYFSEIGPTNDLFFAPSITAPGQNIVAVIPYNPNSFFYNWTESDGTSYSSAFAAGAAALYVNAKGSNVTPKTVKEAFEYSAVPLPVSLSDPSLLTVAAQGAGKLQLANAISSNTVVSPTELNLNDTANFQSIQYVTLKNTGKSTIRYSLKHVPAGTSLTFGTGDLAGQPQAQPVPQVANAASVWLSQSSITLWPGATTIVLLKFTPPSGLDASQFPVYSGYIEITGGSSPVRVPYLGVAARMRDMPIIDASTYAFGIPTPIILDGQQNVQSGFQTYTFQNGDFPTAVYRLVGGTRILTLDLVSANSSLGFTPNYNTRRDVVVSPEVRERELALMKKAVVEPRRLQSSSDSITSSGGGLLSFWCQLTKGKGFGCQSSGPNTYNAVPIVGKLYEANYIARRSVMLVWSSVRATNMTAPTTPTEPEARTRRLRSPLLRLRTVRPSRTGRIGSCSER